MAGIDDLMRALAETTGWSGLAAPDSFGVWRVSLEEDLDAVFFLLGHSIVMRGVVVDLPNERVEAGSLCDTAARRQVAVLRERPSILALEMSGQSLVPGEDLAAARLVCFRTLPLNTDRNDFVEEVQGWLNDLAWWKAELEMSKDRQNGLSGIFSMDAFADIRL